MSGIDAAKDIITYKDIPVVFAKRRAGLAHIALRKLKVLISYVLFVVSVGAFPSDASRSIKVGFFPAAPLVDVKDNAPQGFFIDILDHMAQENNWTLTYVEGTWLELLAKLESGEIDLLPAVGFISARKAIFDFTHQPVFIDSGVVYTGKNTELKDIFYIEGKKVAAVNGSTFTDGFIEYVRSFNIECEMVLVDNNIQVMELIASGDVFAGVTIYSLGIDLGKKYPVTVTPISFSPIALHYAVPKDKNADIMASINSSLGKMKDDPLSIYNVSMAKWIHPKVQNRVPAVFLIGFGVVGFSAFVLGGLSLILRKEVGRKTRYLENEVMEHKKAREGLLRALETNETLLKELYHRTKNTLQLLRSFLSLEAAELKPSSDIDLLVSKTNDRIDSISIVHEMLYQEQNLTNLPIKTYIEKLFNQLSINSGLSTEHITIELFIEDKSLTIEQIVPLGLVINELFTNSLKYAFPNYSAGKIIMKIAFSADGILNLDYRDNGIGFPDEVNIDHPESLGLKLVYLIVKSQLHGSVRIERTDGVLFNLAIPIQEN